MSTHDAEPATPGIVCPECNHANRASARFCSNCGTDLSEQTVIVPARREPPESVAPASKVETVPAAPAPPPDIAAAPAEPFARTSSNSKPWIAIVVAAFVVIAVAAWWFVGPNRPAELGAGPKPLPEPAPAASATRAPAVTPAAPAAASAPASEAAAAPAATPVAPPPVAAVPEAASAATAAPIDTDAQRARAAQARESAARAKAARDAKAKALQDQQTAEQEATRKRADEARSRTAQSTATQPAPAPAATSRSAQEVCAGGNAITRAICESRECGKPEHASEPLCQRVKAAEDRRSGAP